MPSIDIILKILNDRAVQNALKATANEAKGIGDFARQYAAPAMTGYQQPMGWQIKKRGGGLVGANVVNMDYNVSTSQSGSGETILRFAAKDVVIPNHMAKSVAALSGGF